MTYCLPFVHALLHRWREAAPCGTGCPMWRLVPLLASLCAIAFLHPAPVVAQSNLMAVNEQTTVDRVSFVYHDTRTFEPGRLQEQIATRGPSFFQRVQGALPLLSATRQRLNPIELQRDVRRLERFYQRNGFLRPEVDYPNSRVDTTRNTIHIIFEITEGPPIIIQDVNFFAEDGGYASGLFEGAARERWARLRNAITFQAGERYTEGERITIQDQVLSWLQNRGFAFAEVFGRADVDSTRSLADIAFTLDPGPRARFGEVLVEGNARVSDRAVVRQLPFAPGDVFSNQQLSRGQSTLFALGTFRTVLADVPSQPSDTLVNVRYRVRERRMRSISAETGYARQTGIGLQGSWQHRNVGGGARNLELTAAVQTGLLAQPSGALGDIDTPFLAEFSPSLRLPYIFSPQVSLIINPFGRALRDPLLPRDPILPGNVPLLGRLDVNRAEFGLTNTLIYDILPNRPLRLTHTLANTSQFTAERRSARPANGASPPDNGMPGDDIPAFLGTSDVFGRNVLSLSGLLGRTDDFLNPTRGFIIRPTAEAAGSLAGLLPAGLSGVQYYQLSGDLTSFLPLKQRLKVGLRLSTGRIWPRGASREALSGNDPARVSRFRDRFRSVLLFAGGANDVRGWSSGLVGPKTTDRVSFARDDDGDIVFEEDPDGALIPQTFNNRFDLNGALAKLSLSAELRVPFPGLGTAWQLAGFLDAGQVSVRLRDDGRIVDSGTLTLDPAAFKYGTGVGVRYQTPVGFLVRLDLGYKLNPSNRDLQDPRDVFLFENRDNEALQEVGFEPGPPPRRNLRRFNLHLSIGQTF